MRNFAILILVNIMWALQFAGAKIATENLGPITVTVIPMAISTLLMVSVLAMRKRKPAAEDPVPGSRLRIILSFVLLGTGGIVISQLFLTWGIARSLASNAAVITLTVPAITAVLAFFMLGERLTLLRCISFALALAGVLMVSGIDWRSVHIFQGKYLLGSILLFLSCWGGSFYNTYAKKLLRRYSPLEVTVYSFTVCTLVLLPLMLIVEPMPLSRWTSFGWQVWTSLISIAVFSLALATVLFFVVLQTLDVSQAILSVYMSPVFGILIAVVTIHEKITPQLIAGGILAVGSTFLVTTYEERLKRRRIESLRKPA